MALNSFENSLRGVFWKLGGVYVIEIIRFEKARLCLFVSKTHEIDLVTNRFGNLDTSR